METHSSAISLEPLLLLSWRLVLVPAPGPVEAVNHSVAPRSNKLANGAAARQKAHLVAVLELAPPTM